MAIYEITDSELLPIARTSFSKVGVKERAHLQQLLKLWGRRVASGGCGTAQSMERSECHCRFGSLTVSDPFFSLMTSKFDTGFYNFRWDHPLKGAVKWRLERK